MIHIPWKDRYNINYKEIDDQHKGLLDILNELADLQGGEMHADRVADIFHRLCQYALTHFATEERYMAAAGYPDLVRHQGEHAAFIQDLLELNQSHEPGDPRLVEATFSFVKDWYLQHIIRSDLDYAPSVKGYHARAPIEGILFDLGGVICDVDEGVFLQAAASHCERSVEELQGLLQGQPSLLQGYELGFMDTPEFLARLSELFGQAMPEADLAKAYAEVFSPREPVLSLVRRLKGRYKLGLIADTTRLRLERGLDAEITALFNAVTLPCEVKAGKPDPALFRDLLAKLDLLAEECIYVDDKPPLALAATAQLLHGIVGSSAETLQVNLRRMKVDI